MRWQLQWLSVSDAISVQQASGRLQTVHVRGVVVLHVRLYCVCQEIHTLTGTLVTPRTHHVTRRGPVNTAGATAWFDFYSQPHRWFSGKMLTTTIPSPGVYWKILYWLQAWLGARQCCSRRLTESELRHDTSWLLCSCEFPGSGCGAVRHP